MKGADGSSIPAEFSGTVQLQVFTESHEKLVLTLQNVPYVSTLSCCLFSLMSLIEQGLDIKLSHKKGVQIFFDQTHSPVTLKMPNYHLFATTVTSRPSLINDVATKNKQKIKLDLLYHRLGCRSIKTFFLQMRLVCGMIPRWLYVMI